MMALVSGAWLNPNNADPKQQIVKTTVTLMQVWHFKKTPLVVGALSIRGIPGIQWKKKDNGEGKRKN